MGINESFNEWKKTHIVRVLEPAYYEDNEGANKSLKEATLLDLKYFAGAELIDRAIAAGTPVTIKSIKISERVISPLFVHPVKRFTIVVTLGEKENKNA